MKAGSRLGNYIIQDKIAEGGIGIVYLAEEPSLKRQVAIKVLKSPFNEDETFISRFKREAVNAARLMHPTIVQVYSIGEENGLHYFAMEYIPGVDLKQYLRKKIRLSSDDAVDVIIKVADALDSAAKLQMIHRDIKPENIMIRSDGRIKITDFGLAKCMHDDFNLTRQGVVLGTVNYMSPEQGMGEETDSRSDIYSLGIVFFELLAGRPPYRGDHPTSIIYQHIHEPPPPVKYFNRTVEPELERMISRMIAKRPEDRPLNPGMLIKELEAIREGLGLTFHRSGDTGKVTSPTDGTDIIDMDDRDGRHVLVIDDEEEIRILCRKILTDMGMTVFCATNGQEGLELWRSQQPDIILLDLRMPQLGGLAVLEERAEEKLSGKVVIMSAESQWSRVKKAASQHIDDYLYKPFTPELLRERVGKLIAP